MRLRCLFAGWLLLVVGWGARADETVQAVKSAPVARSFAAVSLISDALEVVSGEGELSAHLKTRLTRVPLPSPDFDPVALLAVRDVIQKRGGEPPVVLLKATEKLYSAQDQLLLGTKFLGQPDLDAALAANKVTHLLVVSKVQERAKLQFADRQLGVGPLHGLGFYLSFNLPTESEDAQTKGFGLIAPYAFLKVSMVDVSTSTVTKEIVITASRVIPKVGPGGPWNALTDAQKNEILRDMVQNEVSKAVSGLL